MPLRPAEIKTESSVMLSSDGLRLTVATSLAKGTPLRARAPGLQANLFRQEPRRLGQGEPIPPAAPNLPRV